MRLLIVFYLLIFLLSAPLLQAEEKYLTLEAAVTEVLTANPDAQAARYRSEAAKARIPQAKALEDPLVGVMFDDVPISTTNVKRSEEIDYRIEQKIPFPGKRHVLGRAARFEAMAVDEESRSRIRDVVRDLKNTYYDLYRLNRSLEVNQETQGLFRQLLGSSETAYGTGKTTAAVPLKTQVELTRLGNEEILLQQERTTHMSHLKALLNRHHATEDIQLPKILAWPRLALSLEDVISVALKKRPELKEIEAMEKRDRSRVTAARQGLIPDLSLNFQYGQRPAAPDTWAGTAMINLPVFFWGKNRGAINEAKASLKSTQAEGQSMVIHTRHEINQAYSAVRASEKIVKRYENGLLPQAKTALKAARLGYSTGAVDFMTLIDAARMSKEIQIDYFKNQAMLGTSFTELERLTGTDLEEKQ